jgi:hypothetical protein
MCHAGAPRRKARLRDIKLVSRIEGVKSNGAPPSNCHISSISPARRLFNGRYIVNVTCRGADEAQIRALLVQGFGLSDLHLRELESADIEDTGWVAVTATLTSEKRREIALGYIVGRLSLEPGVTAARWRTVNTIV